MLELTSAARPVVDKFVTMCVRWAGDVRKQLVAERTAPSEESMELRAFECLLYGYALQCFVLGEYDDGEALRQMDELVVLFCNGLSFSSESSRWAELQRLETTVSETMARRIEAIMGYYIGQEGCPESNNQLQRCCGW